MEQHQLLDPFHPGVDTDGLPLPGAGARLAPVARFLTDAPSGELNGDWHFRYYPSLQAAPPISQVLSQLLTERPSESSGVSGNGPAGKLDAELITESANRQAAKLETGPTQQLAGRQESRQASKPADKPAGEPAGAQPDQLTDTPNSGAQQAAADPDLIPVPSHWGLVRTDVSRPIYTNVNFPFPICPPFAPDQNPTADYWRNFTLPAGGNESAGEGEYFTDTNWQQDNGTWVLRVNGIESCAQIWVDGHWVGMTQGSRLVQDFDLSDALGLTSGLRAPQPRNITPAESSVHQILIRVNQYSAGSYIEDQDQWWLPGIFRPLEVFWRPALGITDLRVTTDFEPLNSEAGVEKTGPGRANALDNPQFAEVSVSGSETPGAHREAVELAEQAGSDNPGLGSAQIVVETFAPQVQIQLFEIDLSLPGQADTLNPQTEISDRQIRTATGQTDASNQIAPGAKLDLANQTNPSQPGRKQPLSIVSLRTSSSQGKASFELKQLPVLPWSPGCPKLYRLEVQALSADGTQVLHQGRLRVGFNRIQIVDGQVQANGRRLVIRGVNRHEVHWVRGRVFDREQARADLLLMKRFNINAIRTSHQPSHPEIYDLCDELGLWVMDECDYETHGFEFHTPNGQNWQDNPSDDPRWQAVILDRNRRMVARDFNHPSIFCWSLGNEAGTGQNLAAAAQLIHQLDPSRPVHYEGDRSGEYSDIYSRMYPALEEVDAFFSDSGPVAHPHHPCGRITPKECQRVRQLPFLMVECLHAMGTGPGGGRELWERVDRNRQHLGGFVWEWRDHALQLEPGSRKLGYGGDFGEALHDGNFVCDGLIDAWSRPSPGLVDFAQVASPLQVWLEDEDGHQLQDLPGLAETEDSSVQGVQAKAGRLEEASPAGEAETVGGAEPIGEGKCTGEARQAAETVSAAGAVHAAETERVAETGRANQHAGKAGHVAETGRVGKPPAAICVFNRDYLDASAPVELLLVLEGAASSSALGDTADSLAGDSAAKDGAAGENAAGGLADQSALRWPIGAIPPRATVRIPLADLSSSLEPESRKQTEPVESQPQTENARSVGSCRSVGSGQSAAISGAAEQPGRVDSAALNTFDQGGNQPTGSKNCNLAASYWIGVSVPETYLLTQQVQLPAQGLYFGSSDTQKPGTTLSLSAPKAPARNEADHVAENTQPGTVARAMISLPGVGDYYRESDYCLIGSNFGGADPECVDPDCVDPDCVDAECVDAFAPKQALPNSKYTNAAGPAKQVANSNYTGDIAPQPEAETQSGSKGLRRIVSVFQFGDPSLQAQSKLEQYFWDRPVFSEGNPQTSEGNPPDSKLDGQLGKGRVVPLRSPWLEKPVVAGLPLPQVNLWRAPTDNDEGHGMLDYWGQNPETTLGAGGGKRGASSAERWRAAGLHLAQTVTTSLDGHTWQARTACPLGNWQLDTQMQVQETKYVPAGVPGLEPHPAWEIQLTATPRGEVAVTWPLLVPRIGFTWGLAENLQRWYWVGLGPHCNYADMLQGVWLGTFTQETNFDPGGLREQVALKPQEAFSRQQVRALVLHFESSTWMIRSLSTPFNASVQPYSDAQLSRVAHNWQLPETPSWHLTLDGVHHGIGSRSCGPDVRPEYQGYPVPFKLRFRLVRLDSAAQLS